VLAQTAGLLQDADVELRHAATALLVALHQPGELDGAREPGRPGAHDEHVHLDRLGARWIAIDEPVEREGQLMAGGQNAGHDATLLRLGVAGEAAVI
jgi:hypothetical protein